MSSTFNSNSDARNQDPASPVTAILLASDDSVGAMVVLNYAPDDGVGEAEIASKMARRKTSLYQRVVSFSAPG